jgi:hypothetical protein
VEVSGDGKSRSLAAGLNVAAATEQDWHEEYLRLCMAVRVVANADEAIAHINRYSTKNSESIVTRDEENARKFLRGVDSAAVYWNASTRFTDGGEFGFGAEMGISTQKLHCRGPFALAELTSSKYEIRGTGQVRYDKPILAAIDLNCRRFDICGWLLLGISARREITARVTYLRHVAFTAKRRRASRQSDDRRSKPANPNG